MQNFFNGLKTLLIPPVFEGDVEKNRAAKLLHQITLVSWLLPILSFASVIFGPETARLSIPLGFFFAVILVILRFLNRAGKQLLGGIIIVGTLILLFAYLDVIDAGEIRSLIVLTVLSIVMGGLLLGGPGAIVVSIILMLQHAIVVYLGARGILTPQEATTTPLGNALFVGTGYLLVGLMLRFSIARLETVASQLRENEKEMRVKNLELENLSASLEKRVVERTRDLETVAEVTVATATILETDKLLQEVVNLTKERFNLYHSHIYLMDEFGENLVLAAGAGEPGRLMVAEGRSIPINGERSLVARAARERKGVTVNDITLAPDFLPNPLLPNTRSELAVPMIVGGKVIGVSDIQSDQVGRFSDTDVSIQSTLAAQVATSIQNVHAFEQSKARADLETLVNTIGQKIQRAGTVQETLQTATRELGLALGASRVSATIQTNRDGIDLSTDN
jgi:putative methionine-R-sulfoxide reductase with GAF domain